MGGGGAGKREEWGGGRMRWTRLAATAVDRTRTQRDLVIAETANYAGTDLVCYRAERPPELIARQQAEWQPPLDWAMLRYAFSAAGDCGCGGAPLVTARLASERSIAPPRRGGYSACCPAIRSGRRSAR